MQNLIKNEKNIFLSDERHFHKSILKQFDNIANAIYFPLVVSNWTHSRNIAEGNRESIMWFKHAG